jgi:hypothetical protein
MSSAGILGFSTWPGGIPDPNQARPNIPSGNPYAQFGHAPPPPRQSFTWLWILLAVAGGGVAVCCGCGGMMYMGFNRNLVVMKEDLRTKLDADPEVQARLGKIEELELDFMASVAASEGQAEKRMIFHVRGEKGRADVVGHLQSDNGRETLYDCQLKMPSGEEVDLSF